ncbi:substrate-binding domain-containing protein [Candidatus Clostridium stratigraminis]|uniref:Substrate-binding domain-containing protein n=1 Tax=Candidatus Clostridium stratigraminis TaxID=3381661 RepID=A0ABW8T6J7_9CLOT
MKNIYRINKKIITLSLIIIIAFSITSCNKKLGNDNIDTRKNIEFIVKMRSGDYWTTVQMGANDAAKEFNVNMNFIAPDNEEDIEGQKKLINEAIDKKVDAIVLSASDYEKMSGVVNNAAANKIPVVLIDSGVNSDKPVSFISSDNVEAGKLAGEKLIQNVGKKSKVAILSFVEGSESAMDREKGVIDVLTNYSNVKLVAKEYCGSNEAMAKSLTKSIISVDKDLNGIVALNSAAALGAARALEELGLSGKIKLITFDSTILELQFIEKGVIQDTVVQNPFKMGYLGVEYAAMAARGNKVPKNENLDLKVIDKYNIYNPENQRFIFPFTK